MLERVLVPLDGTPAMATILPVVRELVGGTGAVAHLVVVRPAPTRPEQRGDRMVYLDELLAEARGEWTQYLMHHGSQLAYDGVIVRGEVRFGEPLAETLAAAARHAVHLIAVAAAPQAWLERVLRPNLAHQLVAQSAVAVLSVPPCRPPRYGMVLRHSRLAA